MRLILIGFPKVGKTTIGKALADKLNLPFIDTDQLIEEFFKNTTQTFLSARDIFLKCGEYRFRSIETHVLKSINQRRVIIATGGGSILKENNRFIIKNLGAVVFLKNSIENLFCRIMQNGIPMYLNSENPSESFHLLYQKRKFIYEELADYCLNMENSPISSLLEELVNIWQAIHSAPSFE